MRGGLSAFIAGLGEVEFMSLRKPYRSVDEQLRILRSRGMAVDAGAGHVLRREGHYPIVNGYKDLFLDRKACLTAGDDRYGTGALTRTCTRPSVILAICLTRTITWNCSVASPHWSHGRPPPCHRGDKRSCLLWACANGNWPTGRKSYCAADRSCHWDGGVAGGFGL